MKTTQPTLLAMAILPFLLGAAQAQPVAPAIAYCEAHNGHIHTRGISGAYYSVCVFPDGSECGAHAFLVQACQAGNANVEEANPASEQCYANGGMVVKDDSTSNYLCLSACETCDALRYMGGTCELPNTADAGNSNLQQQNLSPTTLFCEQNGGFTRNWNVPDGGSYKTCTVCTSSCELWAAYRGTCGGRRLRGSARVPT